MFTWILELDDPTHAQVDGKSDPVASQTQRVVALFGIALKRVNNSYIVNLDIHL